MLEPGLKYSLLLVTVLSVLSASHARITGPPQNATKNIQETVEFSCQSNLKVFQRLWLRDGANLSVDSMPGVRVEPDGTLVIPDIKQEYSGKYTCKVYSFGLIEEASAFLVVEYPKKFHTQKMKRSLNRTLSKMSIRKKDMSNEVMYLVCTFVLVLGIVLIGVIVKICEIKNW